MKKHVFSLMMVLAMLGLAGTSAFAQGDGLSPATALQQVLGSTTEFDFTASTSTTITWSVLIADGSTYVAGGATSAATSGTDFNWVTDASGATVAAAPSTADVFIKWLVVPSGTNIYVVRMNESVDASGCSTYREVYISLFDFTFDVFLSTAGGSGISGAATTICNTWDGTVIANATAAPAVDPLDGAAITTPHADYINNPTDGELKLTTTYFTISITLNGGTLTFNDIAMRLQYSLPTQTDLSLYRITSSDGNLEFASSGSANIVATSADLPLTIATLSAGSYGGNNTILIPARTDATGVTTIDYTFEVDTHNNLGANSMVWSAQVDKVDLDFHPDGTTGMGSSFGNGTKVNYAVTGTYANDPSLADGDAVSADMTIDQSPATPVIGITY